MRIKNDLGNLWNEVMILLPERRSERTLPKFHCMSKFHTICTVFEHSPPQSRNHDLNHD